MNALQPDKKRYSEILRDREWQPRIRLFTAIDEQEISEQDYFERLRAIHNGRFPHATVGEEINGS
jgi:hypothetical protein